MSRQGWGGGVALHRVTIMSSCSDHSATTGHLGYEEEGVHLRGLVCATGNILDSHRPGPRTQQTCCLQTMFTLLVK